MQCGWAQVPDNIPLPRSISLWASALPEGCPGPARIMPWLRCSQSSPMACKSMSCRRPGTCPHHPFRAYATSPRRPSPLPGTKRYSTPGHCRGSTFSWSGRYCITTATIDQLGNCRILSVNGVGYSKLDRPARSRAGMVVSNNPEYALEDMADAARAMRLGL